MFAYVGKSRGREGKCTFFPFSYFCHLYQPGDHYLTCERSTETGRTRAIPNPFSRWSLGVANELNHQLTYTQYWKDTEQYLHHNTKANQQWFPQHQETSLFSYLIFDPPNDFLLLLSLHLSSGADPGFFLGGGALVSWSTSTPINHIVFFCRIPVVLENHRSSQGGRGGAHLLHPPPRSAPAPLSLLLWEKLSSNLWPECKYKKRKCAQEI